jgi:hypothetical protein
MGQLQAGIELAVGGIDHRQHPGDVGALGEGGDRASEHGLTGEHAILLRATAHAFARSSRYDYDSDASLSSHTNALTVTTDPDKRRFDQLRGKRI